MAATKKAVAKKTAKRTTAKTTAKRVSGQVKVKMITTVDSAPGRDTTVYFSDGTHAVIGDNKLAAMLNSPESVAPNLIKVTMSRGKILDASPVSLDSDDD